MTLQDYIRKETIEVNDVIKLIEEKRSSLISDRKAAEERKKRTGTLISEKHKIQNDTKKKIEVFDQKLKEINTELNEVERRRGSLLEQLNELNGNKDAAKNSLSQIEQESNKAQKDIFNEDKSIERFDKQIDEKEKERSRFDERIRWAHVSAFKSFLKDSNSLLEQYFKRITSRKANFDAAERLRNKRHVDKCVGDLCDARDEWNKIVKTASVPGVKAAANNELKRIEIEIEKMFPGALEIENSASENNPTTELYYHENEEETILFFPFLEKQWNSMEQGNIDNSIYTFGRFIELIIKESKFSYNDAHLKCENDMVQLVSKFGLGNLKGKNDLTFSIIGKDNMTFILSRIPDEVYKSLNYEEATT